MSAGSKPDMHEMIKDQKVAIIILYNPSQERLMVSRHQIYAVGKTSFPKLLSSLAVDLVQKLETSLRAFSCLSTFSARLVTSEFFSSNFNRRSAKSLDGSDSVFSSFSASSASDL